MLLCLSMLQRRACRKKRPCVQAIATRHVGNVALTRVVQLDYSDYRQLYSDFFSGGLNIKPYPPDPSSGLLGTSCTVRHAVTNCTMKGYNQNLCITLIILCIHLVVHLVKAVLTDSFSD